MTSTETETQRPFVRYSWLLLAYVTAVILWGAYVRASGSGAGCGSHWPLCNGVIVPRDPSAKTLVEFGHRITSGLSAVGVLIQLLWSRRLFARGSATRRWAAYGGALMIIEVMIGAGIVLLQYVDMNASVGRALWMALHLVNTFMLVGALTVTAHAAGGGKPPRFRLGDWRSLVGLAALVGTIFVGASGAVAALGDTLFPAQHLRTALAVDLSATAHILVRLRVVHPFAAVFVGGFLLVARMLLAGSSASRETQRWGMCLRVSVLAQLGLGLVNVMLLAPIWLQLIHLLMADVVWVSLVMMLAYRLGEDDVIVEIDGGTHEGDLEA
jgi:cytochrome c oxidase assembly protein subunit 15